MGDSVDNNVCTGVDTVPAATTRDGLLLPGFQDRHYPYATLRHHELPDGRLDFIEFVPRSHYIWMNYADDLNHHRISELDAADTARGRSALKRLQPAGPQPCSDFQGLSELDLGSPILPLNTDSPREITESFEGITTSLNPVLNILPLHSNHTEEPMCSKAESSPSTHDRPYKTVPALAKPSQTDATVFLEPTVFNGVPAAELPLPSLTPPASPTSNSILATPTELYMLPKAESSDQTTASSKDCRGKIRSELPALAEKYTSASPLEGSRKSSRSGRSTRVLSLVESTNELTMSTLRLAESTRKLLDATAAVAKARRAGRSIAPNAHTNPSIPVTQDHIDNAQAELPGGGDTVPILPELPDFSSLSSVSLPSSQDHNPPPLTTDPCCALSQPSLTKTRRRLPKPPSRPIVNYHVLDLSKVTINDTADAVISSIPAPPASAYPDSVDLPLHLQETMVQCWNRGQSLGQIADVFRMHKYSFFDAETQQAVFIEYLIMRFLMAKGLWKRDG